MTDSEDVKPLGRWAPYAAAITAAVKWLDKLARILIPLVVLIGGTITAYRLERDAKARAQAAKDLSESGYQALKHRAEKQDAEIATMKAEWAAEREKARARTRRRPCPVAPPPKARPLPANLDQAKALVQKAAPAAAPPATPAGKDGP